MRKVPSNFPFNVFLLPLFASLCFIVCFSSCVFLCAGSFLFLRFVRRRRLEASRRGVQREALPYLLFICNALHSRTPFLKLLTVLLLLLLLFYLFIFMMATSASRQPKTAGI